MVWNLPLYLELVLTDNTAGVVIDLHPGTDVVRSKTPSIATKRVGRYAYYFILIGME
jgi:hypothetical protein